MSDLVRPRAMLVLAALATATVASAPTPADLSLAGQYALATGVLAAVLWVTGALPLPVTALLIPVALAVFGVYPDMTSPLAGFADPVVFLLLSGFVLAAALQRHGIDRRVALHVLARVGTSPRRLVLAVMVSTAILSMVISNTATTAMMAPIALGVVGQVTGRETTELTAVRTTTPFGDDEGGAGDEEPANVEVAMLLGTAYAASVGGVGTLVGTPPNAIVVGQLQGLLGIRISFVEWLAVGLPVVVVTLPLVWFVLVYVVYPPDDADMTDAREHARRRLEAEGPLTPPGRRAVAIFGATVLLWVLGGLGFLVEDLLSERVAVTLFGGVGPSVFGPGGHVGVLFYVLVGMAAIPAFVVSGVAEFDELLDVDWGTILLLGGGISLANAFVDTGATTWLASVVFPTLAGAPLPVLVGAVVVGTILVGELASNTAMAAILAPLLVGAGALYAGAYGVVETQAATFLAVTGALAASFGFALPVATPPNAIVFGTGRVDRRHMLRAGVLLDVLMAAVVTLSTVTLARTLWPIVLG